MLCSWFLPLHTHNKAQHLHILHCLFSFSKHLPANNLKHHCNGDLNGCICSSGKRRRIQSTSQNNNNKGKDLMVITLSDAKGQEANNDAFEVLPNEILLCLPPVWQVICKFVCLLWDLLLKKAAETTYRPPTLFSSVNNNAKGPVHVAPFLAFGGHLEVLQ